MPKMRNGRIAYTSKLLLLTLLVILGGTPFSIADTVILKNGMKFDSEKIWEENGEIKCFVNGLVVGFPQEDVRHIVKTTAETPAVPATGNSESVTYDLISSKKDLDRKKQELEREYQVLIQEVKQLANDKKQPLSRKAIQTLNARILQHNQKANEYEIKKKAFDREVKTFQRKVAQESSRQLTDEERFTERLRAWVRRPVDEFIDQWGYPDQIINMPDDRRRYLFMVEITPRITRQITFDTNPSGVIDKLTVNTGKSNEK